jgi:mannan endo-1,4-beta-mannosidase
MVRRAGVIAAFPLDPSTLDVETIPQKGTYFQLIAENGTTQLNTGPNGLQKLDTIFRFAKKHKLYILLTLSNNWNPQATDTGLTSRNNIRPRNTLSNDYGQFPLQIRDYLC